MTLGEKLQQLRKQKGMSQEELADNISVSRQAISKWELGESLPDTKNIIQLGKLFEVSMDYLLNDDTIAKDTQNKKKVEVSEQKEVVQYPKNKLKISFTMLTGCVLSFLGICSLLIFWILSIANPAEYHIGAPIPIGSSAPTGTSKIYDGLKGFLLINKAGGLFVFCCCVVLVGFGIIIFDKVIMQPKKSGLKISNKMRIGCILSYLGISIILLFWILSFANPVINYSNNESYEGLQGFLLFHSEYYAAMILFILSCCITVAGVGILVFDFIKKKNNKIQN